MSWDGVIATLQSFAPPPATVEFLNQLGVPVAGYSISSSDSDPFTVTARFITRANGEIDKFTESAGNGQTSTIGAWTTDAPDAGDPGKVDGADYEIRITFSSGVNRYSSGPGLNVWVALSSDNTWTFSKSTGSGEVDVGSYTIELRDANSLVVQDTGTLTVSLNRETP